MKMYKTDLHVHTNLSSSCSNLSCQDLVHYYILKGYSSVFITDHCLSYYFEKKHLSKWEDIVNYLYEGYECCKKLATNTSLCILPGIEITQKDHMWDYLLLGMDKKTLLKYPMIQNMSLEEILKIAHKHHFILIQAHPRRDAATMFASKKQVDGIEVYNGSDTDEQSLESYQYAKKHHFLMTAGSDSHSIDRIGKTGILSNIKIQSVDDLKKVLESRNYQIIHKDYCMK